MQMRWYDTRVGNISLERTTNIVLKPRIVFQSTTGKPRIMGGNSAFYGILGDSQLFHFTNSAAIAKINKLASYFARYYL
jgi:hypothetical protein